MNNGQQLGLATLPCGLPIQAEEVQGKGKACYTKRMDLVDERTECGRAETISPLEVGRF